MSVTHPPHSPRARSTKTVAALAIAGFMATGVVVADSEQAFAAEACVSGLTDANDYAGGDGSAGSPHEIATAEQLILVSELNENNKHFKQIADTDLEGCLFEPIGNFMNVSYDGGGYVIRGLTIDKATSDNVGLFGQLNAATIKNVGLVDVDITGRSFVGGLVGSFRSCPSGSTMERVFVTGAVMGERNVGGIAGRFGDACGSTSTVTDSYSTASVVGDVEPAGGFAGIVATSGSLTNVYSAGLLAESDREGGTKDAVASAKYGGLVGATTPSGGTVGTLTGSFWDTETSGLTTSFGGVGKTTAQMTSFATFDGAGWDIVNGWEAYDFDPPSNAWGICSRANDGYPFLLWEYTEDPCVVPDSGGGGDTGRNDDDDDDTVAAVATPAPAVTAPVRPRVAEATPAPTATVEGPVLRGGVVSAPPRVPTVLVGGVPTIVEESSPEPTTLSVVAGSLSLGVSVDEGSGGVSRSDDGVNRLSVKSGSAAVLQGSGLQPGARVQVFIPLGVDDSRELASITVAADGTFSGELPVSTDPLAEPLPIGERLLQLVSVDADGNQVVFEMAVNVAQGDPAPALDREAGEIPVVGLGASAVTSAGVVTEATTTALPDQNLAVVEGDTWNMAVAIDSGEGGVEPTDSGALVTLVRDEAAQVSGVGFMAGTRADVWLFSEPVLLGTVTIDENGEFSGEVGIDPDLIPTGEHTLQLQGVGQDGYVKAATMGVSVNDAQPELAAAEQAGLDLGFIWWILAIIVLVAIVVALWLRRNRRA